MSEKLPEDEVDRDDREEPRTEGVDADLNDDNQEGRLHKKSKGYDGTGKDESIPIEQAEEEKRDGKPL
jgi:hypothetical protein